MRPLEGLLVLDFSIFLSGPSAALRLADLGARVIKVERPDGGDLCRQLYISELELDGESTLFHSINRNKESFAANLKDPLGLEQAKDLIKQADVIIQNFRPGVMARLGLDYESARAINPGIVYAEITGYGNEGPWVYKPGQDLLLQSITGLVWLNGDADRPPTPFGLAVVDLFAGAHLVQGILSCLVRRAVTGEGGLVQVSLLESILDFQFEVLTTHLNDGGKLPQRSAINNAHAYLAAPYGIYQTADGFLALAMGSIPVLGALLDCSPLLSYTESATWFTRRDDIKAILVEHLKTESTQHWLDILEPQDIWCSDVLTWERLLQHEGFEVIDMIQEVARDADVKLETTRCPIRIDGQVLKSAKGAPRIGEDTQRILSEFAISS